jgi:hypothetical protein
MMCAFHLSAESANGIPKRTHIMAQRGSDFNFLLARFWPAFGPQRGGAVFYSGSPVVTKFGADFLFKFMPPPPIGEAVMTVNQAEA